jgi:hypothetical protein
VIPGQLNIRLSQICTSCHTDLGEIVGIAIAIKTHNQLTQNRITSSGINLDQPPLTKSEVTQGETLYDQHGRPWIVGKGKRMIPSFSQVGLQGVQAEILKDQPYPFDSEIVQWRKGKS